jgi:hypothetical protein
LVPVRVQLCEPPGLLATRVYVDLVGLGEDAAREDLLRKVSRQTPRPTHASFPCDADGTPEATGEVEFPGADPAATDPSLRGSGASDAGAGAAALSPVVHILGPGTQPDPGFIGRVNEQASLLQLLAPDENEGSAGSAEPVVALSAVAGLGGIGKSALARTVAQTAAARGWFPGGVIWVDLHGFHPGVTAQIRPAQLWPGLLGALGVAEDTIPPTEAAQDSLYHALLNQLAVDGRRVLLVFDNAAAADQVAPLLPMAGSAATGHRILLTSRQTLAELPARLMNLEVLDTAAATQLLTHTLTVRAADEHRHTDDPDELHRLVGLCTGLPLAIVVVGAILAAEPTLSVAELADELDDAGNRLAGLTYGPDLAVRTAFEVSYHRLADDQRAVFARFSVIPGPDAVLPMITAAGGLPQPQTRAAVRQLEIVHLLEPVQPSRGTRRWRMHDLVRLYAREQLDERSAAAER